MNVMRQVRIEKITLNVGAGKDQKVLEKGIKLLKNITGIPPVKTYAKKRIPTWGLRLGLPIGCKITLRGKQAIDALNRLLEAKDFTLDERQFDLNGNLAFGIQEYIDIKDLKYDPEIGVMGLEVCVTFERPGFRVKKRRLKKKKIHTKHKMNKEDTLRYMKKEFNIKVGEEE